MAKYQPKQWKDKIEDAEGNVVQKGTPILARDLEKIESGIVNIDERVDGFNQQLAETTQEINDITSFKNFEVNDKGRGMKETGVVTFWDDDGHISVFDVMYPLFQSEGVPFCTAIVPTWVGQHNRMTLEQLHELQNVGHEITSHSYHHPKFPEISDEDAELDFLMSKQWFIENKLKVNNFALPHGHWGRREKYLAKKHYRSMRISSADKNRTNISPFETHELKTIWFMEGDDKPDDMSGFNHHTLDYYKHYIDKAHAEGSWLIISTHSPNVRDNEDLYRQVVQYAKSKAEILTVNETLNEYGNIIEVGDFSREDKTKKHFTVGFDGEIKSHTTDTIFVGENTVVNSTDISEYKSGMVSVHGLSNAHVRSNGFPGNYGGTLYTHRRTANIADDSYSYQDFKNFVNESFSREYVVATGRWGNWKKRVDDQYVDIMDRDAITNETPANDFRLGITSLELSSDAVRDTNFPGDTGGVIHTYKPNTNAFAYQEFHTLTNKKYTRQATSSTVWSAWVDAFTEQRIIIPDVDAFTASTPFSSFPVGVTYSRVSSTNATGTPTSGGGTLITHKLSLINTDRVYSFQEYHAIDGGLYKRNINADATFGSWMLLNNV